ncbi:MAG: 1-deoxy-D-xylulose-5-phosphate synthase [Deltaproteobacteria bacterium]|nr:1-deoxy-D-xylulose-5-phosphate synthase [Deltaproteobacteria bacterium]
MDQEIKIKLSEKPLSLLEGIMDPKDLKNLSLPQLKQVAEEVRQLIIETVSKNGGHLAPNLGVVELTIALHYVFESPKDKIIWDVGHQSYTHKILTGRKAQFPTLRTFGGLSGFPKRQESPHDIFDTGHSGTSISAGLGITVANELKKEQSKVIAVIGDGSMTAGEAFEGLNQAGHLNKDLIVVLNDNEMSISQNVGALSSFLSKRLTGRGFVQFKREMESFFKSIPGIGENLLQWAKKSEDSFTGFFTPGMLFAALHFDYLGPVKGHRLEDLIATFENIRHIQAPVLVHVLTTKGKGYGPAEKNPAYYHGVGPFDPEAEVPCPQKPSGAPTYTEVFGKTIVALAEKDIRILAITAAMPEGTGLDRFARRFPQRFFDCGIAEQHAVTFAAGLALEGLKPVVAIYSTFIQRAFDQVLHDICLPNIPVIFALDRAGIVGEDGPTHQGLFDLSFLRPLPNLIIMAPKDERELRDMLYSAVHYNRPVAIRYPRGAGVGVSLGGDAQPIPLGQWETLKEGTDVAVLALGNTVYPALEAGERLTCKGKSAAVVNARFLKPLDERLLAQVAQRFSLVVTVEENMTRGGLGSAVMEKLHELRAGGIRVRSLGIPDRFVEHGPSEKIRSLYGLDAEGILRVLMEELDVPQNA